MLSERVNKMLAGKTAVVTGANRGIGYAIVQKLLAQGADVFAVVRKKDRFIESDEYRSLVEVYPARTITVFEADFSKEEEVKVCAKSILAEKKDLDILVNVVGMVTESSMYNLTKMETVHDCFQVNFFSPLLFTQSISKRMVKRRYGKIVFISSIAPDVGGTSLEYAASKGAVNAAVKRLAIEYGNFGIDVNAVAPGPTDTDMLHSQPKHIAEYGYNRTVKKRLAMPEEIANVVLFLMSDMSSYMTGQIVTVNGGVS